MDEETEVVRPSTVHSSTAPYMGVMGQTGKDPVAGVYFFSHTDLASAVSRKYIKNKDLNAVIYGKRISEDETNGEYLEIENLRTELYDSFRNDNRSAALSNRRQIKEKMDGGSSVFFREPLGLIIDKELVRWTEEEETGGDNGGTQTVTYEGVSIVSPPFDISKINQLQGMTFENCYIGGPFDDLPSILGGIGEYVRLRYLNLDGTKFINCKIGGKDVFENSELNGATFQNCYFRDVDFTLCKNAWLYSTEYSSAVTSWEAAKAEAEAEYNEYLVEQLNAQGVTIKSLSTNKDPLGRSHSHNKRPYDYWGDTLYEDIDSRDYSYNGEVSYIDFSGSYFENCTFSGQELIGLNLKKTIFYNCAIKDTRIHESSYDTIKIQNSTLTNSKFVNFDTSSKGELILASVILNGVWLVGFTLNDLNFTNSNFVNSYLGQCILNNCSFAGIDLSEKGIPNSKLKNCNLNRTNLENASFVGSSFENCSLENFSASLYNFPNFKNCSFKNTAFSTTADASYTDFFGCTFENMTLGDLKLIFSNFNSAKLNNVKVQNCAMNGVTSYNSKITNTTFSNSELRGVKFNESSINGTKFVDCSLRGASFEGVDTSNSTFENSDITGISY